jgi:transcriptional regulator with XRE-family HTH domain
MAISKAETKYIRERTGTAQDELSEMFGMKSVSRIQRIENPDTFETPTDREEEICRELFRNHVNGTQTGRTGFYSSKNDYEKAESHAFTARGQLNAQSEEFALLKIIKGEEPEDFYIGHRKNDENMRRAKLKRLRSNLKMTSYDCAKLVGLKTRSILIYETADGRSIPSDEQLEKMDAMLKQVIEYCRDLSRHIGDKTVAVRGYRNEAHYRKYNLESDSPFWLHSAKINILELFEEQKKDCKTGTVIRMFYPEEVPEENEDLQWIPLSV